MGPILVRRFDLHIVVVLAAMGTFFSSAACKHVDDEEHDTKPARKKLASSPASSSIQSPSSAMPPAMPGCAEDNRQIYVVSSDGDLYRFPPLTKSFTLIGRLDCPIAGLAQPFSMAVDRDGVAWILYQDGHVFRARTRDAHCIATKFVPDQHGIHTFGMAFVTDGPASTHDTLYLADDDASPRGLSTLDVATLTVSPPHAYDESKVKSGRFDLTGTGDGRIFGFDPRPPARIVEIEPTTAKIIGQKSVGAIGDRAWAIAQYWGAFYVFSATSGNSQVVKLSWATGKEEVVSPDVGFTVVGAGVSSCAPAAQ
jgi:hypothetical protein